MSKGGGGGIGIGSASIVLVFAVLCLSVFSLITFVVAGNDKALVDAEASLVTGYYAADALAEQVLAEIMETGLIPEDYPGVSDIRTLRDAEAGVDLVEYRCIVTEKKALSIKLSIDGESYEILSWKMVDTDEWILDERLDVWTGD